MTAIFSMNREVGYGLWSTFSLILNVKMEQMTYLYEDIEFGLIEALVL